MSSLVKQEIARVQSAAEKALTIKDSTVSTELIAASYSNYVYYKVYATRTDDTDVYTFIRQEQDESTKAFIKRLTREIKEHFKV